MTPSRPTRTAAASAGIGLVATMVVCAGAGYGLGSLVDLAVPLGLLGLFAGVFVGLFVVHARFRRI
jgi:hypothetical protein